MAEGPSRLLALYHGLSERLGPELADTLMTYLPSTPATELATKADIDRLDSRLERLEDEIRHLSHRLDDAVDRLSQRMDRQHYTMMAGFVALTTALIASGLLG
jgi:hypothetical protein